ncbi:MAG: hypothetical protein WAO71_09980 [Gallionella sp.]
MTTLCLLSSLGWGATPPNSIITNTATAAYSIGVKISPPTARQQSAPPRATPLASKLNCCNMCHPQELP